MAWGPEEQELARDRYALRRGRGQHPRLPSPFVDRLARVIYAFLAGATLIVPMLIMTVNGPYAVKSVVTVCVAVFLFGIAAALGVKLENNEIFAVTATYAAVLVVFIGVTTDTGTSAGG
jgi:VIT1/CCC1 family predicted Fe2+/Mn2+ transporter